MSPPDDSKKSEDSDWDMPSIVDHQALVDLMSNYVKHSRSRGSSDTLAEAGQARILVALAQQDYQVCTIDNSSGEFCGTYPHTIILLGMNYFKFRH